MIMFIVFAVIVSLVVAIVSLDWLLAGRADDRSLGSARHGGCDNANVDYAVIDRQGTQTNFHTSI
jgi:hypothetical protein